MSEMEEIRFKSTFEGEGHLGVGTEWGSAFEAEKYRNENPFTAKHTSKFWKHTLPELKDMVASASPSTVRNVGEAWLDVGKDLDGGSSGMADQVVEASLDAIGVGGGIKGVFDRAIKEVREHWDGKAAQMFEARAREISRNISHAAEWARSAGDCLTSAGDSLEAYGPFVLSIEEPSGMDSAGDRMGDELGSVFGGGSARDDGPALSSLEQGVPTHQVLESSGGQLSAGREAQLRGAVAMEYLGAAYKSVGKGMPDASPGGPGGSQDDWKGDPPGDNGGVPRVPPSLPPHVTSPRPTPPNAMPSGPKGPGYTTPGTPSAPRHIDVPDSANTPKPPPRTNLDGLSGGGAGGGIGGPGMGGGSAGAHAGGAGGGNGGTSGMPGGAGSGAAPGGGASSGRGGMPGMGGGAGGGAGKSGGGGRGGALARQRGGAVSAAKGNPGVGGQGGSGLHRSRGGTQAGKPGGGMSGAHGASGANGKSKNSRDKRPDYLAEEEDTWIKQRNVAPRVIE
ncbi:hypothetical protein ACIQNI_22020 [Streptomyces sp. NPDC091266]|uniref:hypothetical protein n=1 Tax=Streptomyces sp. NPDC091266 TaxID=3365978 RepID=UPI00380E1ABF